MGCGERKRERGKEGVRERGGRVSECLKSDLFSCFLRGVL